MDEKTVVEVLLRDAARLRSFAADRERVPTTLPLQPSPAVAPTHATAGGGSDQPPEAATSSGTNFAASIVPTPDAML